MKTNTKTILLFIMCFALIGLISFTYAYFSNDIVNNNVKDQVVETGTLSLRYVDGAEINMQNIKPGSTITKTIYVANTGTLDAKYNLVWQELANEITNDEMVIEAKCTRMDATTEEVDGTCESLTETPIKRIKIKENVSIEPSIVHKYDITITFKEMNKDQNYNQGKTFTGALGVKEYKAPETIYCTFDGELVQGAEYVNGQYTYRYMQEGTVGYHDMIGNMLQWNDITEDGWGVARTDINSNDALTDKICTFINDKPVVSLSSLFAFTWTKSIDLDSIDTSNVKNMSGMFNSSQATTLDLSSFDTSNVTDMSNMFEGSYAKTLDIENFNISNVINMSRMFSGSKAETLDVSSFDTSKVINMSGMFNSSQATTLDLSNFYTSKVTDMSEMFSYSAATTLDLSNFDTSKVTNMKGMFAGSQATTIDVSNFDTSNVTSMNSMFSYSSAGTINISNFNTSKVTDMSWMFDNSKAVTINGLENFDTSKVTDMSYMFLDSSIKTLDLSSFDTSNVTNMFQMFTGSQATTLDLSDFNTSKVTDMSYMFSNSQATTLDVSNFDTSNVTSMTSMFYNSKATVLDLSNFDTTKVTAMSGMFRESANLKTIYISSKFVTTNVKYSTDMFTGCTSLSGGQGTVYNSTKIDKTYARVDGGTSSPGYFTLKSN